MISESLTLNSESKAFMHANNLQLVKITRDPNDRRQSIKDSLMQESQHRERRPSRVLVRLVPASNVTIHRNEADYCDSTNINLEYESAVRRTILTPIITDFNPFCKLFLHNFKKMTYLT